MTSKIDNTAIPIMMRHAIRLGSNQKMPRSHVDVDAEDPFPSKVQRHSNGMIANRDSSLTEVGQETTDDN